MDAFVKFLLDYYIWILAVIGIIIVTVIGFLVDSKQKRRKKEEAILKNSAEVKTTEDLVNVNAQENVSMNNPVNVQDVTSVNNVLGGDGSYINEPVKQEQVPVTNTVVDSGLNLNSQVPQFAPREVNIPVTQPQNEVVSTNVEQIIPPKPVNAVPINQVVQPTPVTVNTVNPVVQPTSINVTPVTQSVSMTQQPLYNQALQNVVSSSSVGQAVVMPQSNVNQNMVISSASLGGQSNDVVVPNVQQSSLNNQAVNSSVVQSTMPLNANVSQMSSQPQQVNHIPNVGINFVTGVENASDDTWKL